MDDCYIVVAQDLELATALTRRGIPHILGDGYFGPRYLGDDFQDFAAAGDGQNEHLRGEQKVGSGAFYQVAAIKWLATMHAMKLGYDVLQPGTSLLLLLLLLLMCRAVPCRAVPLRLVLCCFDVRLAGRCDV